MQLGTVAANENKSTRIKMMDSRTQQLSAPECRTVMVEHREARNARHPALVVGRETQLRKQEVASRPRDTLVGTTPPSAALVLSGSLTVED